jgi:hypothetical protein
LAPATWVIEVSAPVSVSCGWAGWPSAFTPSCPGNMIDESSGSVLCRTTVTFCPDVTHSVGPGSWNLPVDIA